MAFYRTRQISEEDKQAILERHGRVCYATGHSIADGSEIEFDHIKAFAKGGESSIDNIAPMCREHNKKKGLLPLHDFRIKLQMEEFFRTGKTLTLKDELKYFVKKEGISDFGQHCYTTINGEEIETEIADRKHRHALFTCKTTGWKYFYAIIPVEAINSDDDEDGKMGLQPRYLILDKTFDLYRHFQRYPVLQPSIARLYKDKILVFDGQHKIAAMLWEGKRNFDIKIYLDPDPELLNSANIAAHDKFAQTRFYASVMVEKLGAQFGKRFSEYKNDENDEKKSEYGFVEYIKSKDDLTKGEANKRFRSFLFKEVLDKECNDICQLVSQSNRGSNEHPLTMDVLSKAIFANFLYTHPIDEQLSSSHYKRAEEIKNVITLCNMLYNKVLCEWDAKAATGNPRQNRLARIFRSKSMMAWSVLVRDSVLVILKIHDSDEREKLFYRELLDASQIEEIEKVLQRLKEWPAWASMESNIDHALGGNRSEIKDWMKERGLTTGYLLGAPE